MAQTLSNPPGTQEAASPSITIRRARIGDVPVMARLINEAAEFGLMLPKSLANLYETVRNFHVAEVDLNDGPRVVGVCALSVIWANLAELASLAVAWDQRGKGLGKVLAKACLEEAHELGIARVMTLTYEQRFFNKLGFEVIDRANLPHKVWSECVRCPKNEACDEIAMMRTFEDIPDQQTSEPPISNAYDVPVVLTRTAAGPAHSD